MTTISTPHYLLDQARRRITPTVNNIPGMGVIEKRLVAREWDTKVLAEPPEGSGLEAVRGPAGLPLLGHVIESFRQGPDYPLSLYQTWGPVVFVDSPVMSSVITALGPDATQAVFSNKNKDFSQRGWHAMIGPFFKRGMMLLDFDEHRHHRRIMQEAFTRTRLAGYVEHIDRVATHVIGDWPSNDARFLLHPAVKELTLDIASTVFMGHEHGTDDALLTKVNRAFTTTTRAGGAIIHRPIPPFKWWRGLRARKVLEDYFMDRVRQRRAAQGTDMLTALCNAEDDDGNSFTDKDIVNHMIFLMMAAHDTTTSTITTMVYNLAAHPQWQERAREESERLGDGPLDIDGLERLETLDLVMNESLRLVTPLTFNLREAVRDTELLGHFVPAGTKVILWPSANHRMPELWTEPDKFDPERFAEPRSEHKRHRYAFAPFGGGAHKCIGMVFAQLEIKVAVHRLLRAFRLELTRPNYRAKWDYAGMPIPMDGMPIVLRPL